LFKMSLFPRFNLVGHKYSIYIQQVYIYISLKTIFLMWKICHHAKSENIMQPSQQAFLKSKIFARKVKEKYWVHQVYTLDYLLVGSWKVAGFFKKIALLRKEREREKGLVWGQILWFFGQTIWKILLL
jgi:hypothetical protein